MILRRIFAEILHGVDHLRAILNLIENDKRLFRHDLLTACQHQVLQNPVNILRGFKELLILLIFVEVKISGILIVTPAKLLQNPGFTHLTNAFKNQWFPIRRILPVQQLLYNISFHRHAPHTFMTIFVHLHHTFIVVFMRGFHTFINIILRKEKRCKPKITLLLIKV